MAWIAVATAAVTSTAGYLGSQEAARTQAGAADRATQLQREQFQRQEELYAPYRKSGELAQNRLLELLGLGEPTGSQDFGSYSRGMSGQELSSDPGYRFRLDEGLRGLDKTAAARGGLLSGNALRGAMSFGQDYASNEYQNAFNRRQSQLSPLFQLAGQGAGVAGQLGQAGQQYAGAAGELGMGGANARAAGIMGGTNALTGGLTNYLRYQQSQDLLNELRKPYSQSAPSTPSAGTPSNGYSFG